MERQVKTPLPPLLTLQRSELAVPATSPEFFAKAAAGPADAVFLDLEDAVAPNNKEEARANAIEALREHDWGGKLMSVRINGLDTAWALRDIVELVTHAPRLDLLLIPKVGKAADVEFADRLLTLLERDVPRSRQVGIEVLIETAMGVAHAEEIAASSPRLQAMIFGVGDYSVDMLTGDRVFGKVNPLYAVDTVARGGERRFHVNDQWHFALARIANACRAYGVRPIDGPYTDYGDPEGYRASAERARALGFEGKWAIHPSQVDLANAIFSPSEEDATWARKIVTALESSNLAGKGAVGVDNVLVDMAHAKIARHILDRAAVLAERSPSAEPRP
jgi:malyl-CoA/(S)-citramalyl-CoA lyase